MSGRVSRDLYLLAGPTATGKSEVAHHLARGGDWAVLSADAMLVYEGMDIGTAKPTAAERAGLTYGGIDWATPDQPFSVGQYLEKAHEFLRGLPPDQPVVVTGGTGLYIKALLIGLDPMPSTSAALRAEVEEIYAATGLTGLQEACKQADPDRYADLKDPRNPRRLMRAVELARMGAPRADAWKKSIPGKCVGLTMERALLNQRIADRVDTMYENGLMNEVRALQARYPRPSDTARMAIGYREAQRVVAGEYTVEQAKAETIRRTRRYARRQETWFRHQIPLTSVEVTEKSRANKTAERVRALWSHYGPCRISC